MWSAMKSRITAASIISRSANGSKIRPNSDSTCQRRARKPSIWSVMPAIPKTIPAAQLCPFSALSISATNTGMRISRATVSAFGSSWSGAGTTRVAICLAPHSVRAVTASWLEEIGRYAATEELPLHVHADEQPREIEECVAEHGIRPIELLARTGCLSERTTVVHATHADGAELDLLAQAGARICACPTTEANLGDGFLPVERVCTRGIGICIGSDSNVRIDPLEELRELEGIARRQTGRRNVISTETLLCFGADEGAGSLGLETWDDVEVDLSHPSLRGVEDVFEGLIFGCAADVFLP